MKRRVYTLCFVRRSDEVLLGMKKRGFKAGYWNGLGGKVEAGESIESAVCREVQEEAGIEIGFIKKIGVIEFRYPEELMEVHIFLTTRLTGQITETEEIKPRWFPISRIPYASMLPDAIYWLPLVLRKQPFRATFVLNKQHKITDLSVKEKRRL